VKTSLLLFFVAVVVAAVAVVVVVEDMQLHQVKKCYPDALLKTSH
jgi:hypothetical protein